MATIIYRDSDEGGVDHLLENAEATFVAANDALRKLIAEIEAGDLSRAEDFKSVYTHFKSVVPTALAERERLAREKAKRDGIAEGAGYALDFDEVRDEVGRRLASIAAARGEGGVSG